MHRWFQNLLQAIKIKTLVIAACVFVVGNWSLHSFILAPSQAMVKSAKADLAEMEKTYVQLKSTDMSEIRKSLEREVHYLNEKQTKIFSNLLTEEQIPLLISRLEREAEASGLEVRTNISREKKNAKKKNAKTQTFVTINLNYTGTLEQLLSFLNKLENWNEIVLIRNFHIYSRDSLKNILNGQVQFISLIDNQE